LTEHRTDTQIINQLSLAIYSQDELLQIRGTYARLWHRQSGRFLDDNTALPPSNDANRKINSPACSAAKQECDEARNRNFRMLLRGLRFVPRIQVTDKLASYGVAHRRLIPSGEHRGSSI
jgi:hypothetical protein